MVDALVVPKHANHLVGNTVTVISRSSIIQGGIIKTVRGKAGIHTDFTQEAEPLTGTENLVLIADRGDFRFKPGRWAPQTFDSADVVVSTNLIILTAHAMLELQGPFQFRPGAVSALDQLPGGLTPFYATGLLTLTVNALNTETVLIDAKTYTFQTILTDVDGNVLIGATDVDSVSNLIAAITLGAGSGTTYAASTTLHPTVTAGAGVVPATMDARAKTFGTAGNALSTTETLTNGSWANATLLGGLDAINYFIIPGADDNSFKVATTVALALAGTAVDITGQGVGTHTITGTHNFADVPAASVVDGSGAVKLPQGRDVVIQDEEFVTVQGALSDDVLTYFWTP